jgi:hypothetical protein
MMGAQGGSRASERWAATDDVLVACSAGCDVAVGARGAGRGMRMLYLRGRHHEVVT